MGFSAARRSALKRAGAAGLSLLLPGCERKEPAQAQSPATGDFTDGTLRLDLRQRVSAGAESFELERVRYEAQWPGRRNRLAERPDWGDYRLSVYSAQISADREIPLLFRQGFDTGVVSDTRAATAQVSVRFPAPLRPARATIEKRRGESVFQAVASFAVDPAGADIDRSPPQVAARVDTLLETGAPAARVDVAILGDGYREAEYPGFAADAARAAEYLFSVEPFKSRRRDFNVRAVFVPSAESGVSDPYLGLARNTVLRCAYGSGAAERTLAVGNELALREIGAATPYDFLLVLANARRYGGSASFGGPAVVAIGSGAAKYLVVHELAHAMAGLAEEYYVPAGSGPAYGGNVEPWQPNVTIAPQRAKWRNLLPDPPRAADWNKTDYDRRFAAYVRRYEKLRASGADEPVVERLMQEQRAQQAALLAKNGNSRSPGCYEGANGYARGMYRSALDCIMFSLQSDYFCPACTAALTRAIDQECG